VIIERLVPVTRLDEIDAELDPHVRATDPGGDEFAGRNTRRTGALIARSPAFRELAAHPLVLAVSTACSTQRVTSSRRSSTSAGEPAQMIRDQWAFGFFRSRRRVSATRCGLTDFTDANGGRIDPPDNRWADGPTGRTVAAEIADRCSCRRLAVPRRWPGASGSVAAASTSVTRCPGCGRRINISPAHRDRAPVPSPAPRRLPTAHAFRLFRRPARSDRSVARPAGTPPSSRRHRRRRRRPPAGTPRSPVIPNLTARRAFASAPVGRSSPKSVQGRDRVPLRARHGDQLDIRVLAERLGMPARRRRTAHPVAGPRRP
jgi:hypothetical protein